MRVSAKLSLVLSIFVSAQGYQVNIVNNCAYNVWAGYQGQSTGSGGFSLNQGDSNSIQVTGNGNVYGLTGCDGNGQGCDSTSGTSTLAEFNWDSGKAKSIVQAYYE